MIDSRMLRDLGWNDDLIEEVTRAAELIRGSVVTLPEVSSVAAVPHAVGSSHIRLDPQLNLTAKQVRSAT